MAFAEELKARIRKRAHFCCCLCHTLGVEIHHIVPRGEGGPDDEDNAAPLCPTCHEIYGANAEKRKFIREAREFWFEICTKRFGGDSDQLDEIYSTLKTVATKDDVERLSIRNSSYTLGATTSLPAEHLRYAFTRDEYVHPLIVRELLGWLSDPFVTVASIDLVAANRSNRFFGSFSIRKEAERPSIEWEGDRREWFAYSHIATSPSGVQMLECRDCGGGTGVFTHIALLALEHDRCFVEREWDKGNSTRDRILLKSLGALALGGPYSGEIEYRDGLLSIGPDVGWFARGAEAARAVPIR